MTDRISPKWMSELGAGYCFLGTFLFLPGVTEVGQGETTSDAETMVNKADQGTKADQGYSGTLA
jgi:predicted RNase H-like HicB family nuclease